MKLSDEIDYLRISADEIKIFVENKLTHLQELQRHWNRFEICFHHAEEIFKEPNEVNLLPCLFGFKIGKKCVNL